MGVLLLLLAGSGCGGGPAPADPDGGMPGLGPDATAASCPAAEPAADLCTSVPAGTVVPCSRDAEEQPSQTGYLDITLPDGQHVYTCATSWTEGGQGGGYWFDAPDGFMSDPQSCCGGAPTPVASPTASASGLPALGALHGPQEIKPQESAEPGAGPLRHNPFAVTVRDRDGATAFASALANWQAWSTDGQAHPGPDGSGDYYFVGLGVNYVVTASADGQPVLVIGPEVSTTSDGKAPLGHPTLGACATGGGAPLALLAGEVWGATINNRSGRFNHGSADTMEALAQVANLFNCFGISITGTTYYPPKP
jgi:hypothetical protein